MTGPDVVLLAHSNPADLGASSLRRPGTLMVNMESGQFARYGAVVELRGARAWFALALVGRPGYIISRGEIVEILHCGREDGGPDHAVKLLDLHWMSVRAALAALGYVAERFFGRGFMARPIGCRVDEAEPIDIPRFLEVRA